MICVANVDGEISAIDNVCLHQGGPLGQGTIEEGKVVCPWHGWMFDPKTGEVGHSSSVRIPVYSIKRDGDSVYVEL
jgi:nitrite reductase (NADH) small subunit